MDKNQLPSDNYVELRLNVAILFAICLTVLILICQKFKCSENVVLPNTQILKIYSNHTKQNCKIYVSVPASYKTQNQTKYPTLFLLDADYSFALAKNITEHLSARNHIQESLLFAIAYDGPDNYKLNRTRDYTPTYVPEGGYGEEFQKYSGGAPAFALFIEKELLPYLQKKFRISQNRILVGHSYGGLFASWILLTRNSLFDGYLIVSPSLWYAQRFIFKIIKEFQANSKNISQIFFGIGEKETQKYGTEFPMVEDMQEFVNILQKPDFNFKVNSFVFDEENHSTVFPVAFTRGVMILLEKQKK